MVDGTRPKGHANTVNGEVKRHPTSDDDNFTQVSCKRLLDRRRVSTLVGVPMKPTQPPPDLRMASVRYLPSLPLCGELAFVFPCCLAKDSTTTVERQPCTAVVGGIDVVSSNTLALVSWSVGVYTLR